MIDPPEKLQLHVAMLPNVEIRSIFGFVAPYFAANPIANILSWTTRQLIREADSFEAASQNAAPTPADFDRVGDQYFQDGFSFRTKHLNLVIAPFREGHDAEPNETFDLPAGWQLSVICYSPEKASDKDFLALTQFLTGLLRDLAKAFAPLRGAVSRETDSYIGPTPPLADADVVAACLPTDLVPLNYDDADAFWSAWDQVDYLGQGLAIVERGVKLVAETDFKALTSRRGLDLLRAAKPGLATYYLPQPSDAEQAMLDALPSYLEPVGYRAADKRAEFTAFVPEDDNLNSRDFSMLLQLLQFGTVDDQEVDLVVITFPNRQAAMRDAAPLHAIGARVQYLDSSGEWLELAP